MLATDFRISTADARIGLPETSLGIMPGFGGSVRLPRLIGTDSALEIIAAGKNISGKEALKIGLVDAVVDADTLRDAGITMLKNAVAGKLEWQSRREPKRLPLKLSQIEATMSFSVAKSMVHAERGETLPCADDRGENH